MNLQNEITAVMEAIQPKAFDAKDISAPEQIIAMVCEKLEMSEADFFGPKRKRDFVENRAIASQLIIVNSSLNFTQLAPKIGRDRSVLYYYIELFDSIKLIPSVVEKIKKVNKIDYRLCEI